MTGDTITRNTLVDALFQEVGLSRHECADLLEDVLKTVTDRLAEGTHLKIANFGSFSVRHKRERMGRNPKTGEEVPMALSQTRLRHGLRPTEHTVRQWCRRQCATP